MINKKIRIYHCMILLVLLLMPSALSDNSPTVSLISPSNANTTTNQTVVFNCSATDDINLKNITLYLNYSSWHANETIRRAIVIEQGIIKQTQILSFQNRNHEFPHEQL